MSKLPGRDGCWTPTRHLFKGFPAWIDGLQHHEPAEQQPGWLFHTPGIPRKMVGMKPGKSTPLWNPKNRLTGGV